ncbi:MAG: hypothetical protein NWE84_05705 [Candidatus Bathyarchaeota archaeon]|nr:hypothetical protein [Candidatus Bathyarchaeota archaeon]
MGKKMPLKAVFVLVLLLPTAVATQFVNFGQANPYIRDWKKGGEIPPPEGTLPPIISLLSPKNNSAYSSNNVSLTFNVSMPESNTVSFHISELYYVPSWKQGPNGQSVKIDLAQGSINLTDVPEGPRWLEVYAVASAVAYESDHKLEGIHYTTYLVIYKITSSSLVHFTIDNTAPRIMSVSVENKIYSASELSLDVVVDELTSEVIYSLGGKGNITVAGNATLTDLPEGAHSLTVYVLDLAGNAGTSEIIYFSVDVPELSLTSSVAASGALIAIISISLLVYFRKRNGGKN